MRNKIDKVNHIPASPDEILETLHTVMHLFRSRQYRSLRDSPVSLTHMEGKVLGFFGRHPGATLSALVGHSGRDKGQLARLISSLRERGLLEARADESDRRNQHLHLTEEGKAIQCALHQQGHHLSAMAVEGLGLEEQAQLHAYLVRLRQNLEAEAD